MDTDADSALNALEDGEAVAASSQGLKTVGALDLGGSSLEVTFIPSKPTPDAIKGAHNAKPSPLAPFKWPRCSLETISLLLVEANVA